MSSSGRSGKGGEESGKKQSKKEKIKNFFKKHNPL